MSSMNPMDVAWLVLKDEPTTITDFMGYTRPQLEQMLIMFQNELVRRGHTSAVEGVEDVEISPDAFDTYQIGESRAMRDEPPPPPQIPDLMTRLMAGETLTPEELIALQAGASTLDEHHRNEEDEPSQTLSPDDILAGQLHTGEIHPGTMSDIRDILVNDHNVDPSAITTDGTWAHQYMDFLRLSGRHPTTEEVNMHLG